MKLSLCACPVLAGLLFLAGCGGSDATGVEVTGKILKAGQPLEFMKPGDMKPMSGPPSPENRPKYIQQPEVELFPEGGGANATAVASAMVEKDGTFRITGVTPGKYKVAVKQLDMSRMSNPQQYVQQPGAGRPGSEQSMSTADVADIFEGKLSGANTPIVKEVPAGASGAVDWGTIDIAEYLK